MTYNDVLLKVLEVVRKLKAKKDPDYKEPETFKIIKDLFQLEKNCGEYLKRLEGLNKDGFGAFSALAKVHKSKKDDLKNEYQRLFMVGVIDEDNYQKEYKTWYDYVIAIILNELKGDFLSANFISLFNEEVGFNALPSNDRLLSLFKDLNAPFDMTYKKLINNPKELNHAFKLCFKELEVMGKIFEINGYEGLVQYISCLNDLLYRSYLENSLTKFGLVDNDQGTEVKIHDGLIDIYLDLENSESWFANHNLSLMINLTSDNSVIKDLYKANKNICASSTFLNYLCNNEFYDLVVSNERGVPHFKDLSNLIDKFLENMEEINDNIFSPHELFKILNKNKGICEDAIKGKFEVGKTGYGSK